MAADATREYFYPWAVVGKEYFVMAGGVAVPLGILLFAENSPRTAHAFNALPIWVPTILCCASAVMLIALCYTFFLRRPICVDNAGLTLKFMGQSFRHLDWQSIDRIEKIRVRDTVYDRYMLIYQVRASSGTAIRFQDDLADITVLLAQISQFVHQYNIEIWLIDRGGDTLEEQYNRTSDPAQRKRLWRDGYKERIASL